MTLRPTSLVICTRDRPRFLVDTLGSLFAGDALPDQIVVVDQSRVAGDLGPLAAADGRLRVVRDDGVGLGRARNVGLAAATGELVGFLDDDMWVDRTWWSALVSAAEAAGPRAVITGQVGAAAPEVPGGIAPSTMTGDATKVYEGRLETDVLAAGNMIVPREVFTAVGPFDDRLGAGARFPSSEDNDFGYRLLAAGYRIVYEPRAKLLHRAWRTKAGFVRLRWCYGRGSGAYYAKHLAAGDRGMAVRLRRDVARQLGKVPDRLRTREARLLLADLAFATGLTVGATQWWLTERGRR